MPRSTRPADPENVGGGGNRLAGESFTLRAFGRGSIERGHTRRIGWQWTQHRGIRVMGRTERTGTHLESVACGPLGGRTRRDLRAERGRGWVAGRKRLAGLPDVALPWWRRRRRNRRETCAEMTAAGPSPFRRSPERGLELRSDFLSGRVFDDHEPIVWAYVMVPPHGGIQRRPLSLLSASSLWLSRCERRVCGWRGCRRTFFVANENRGQARRFCLHRCAMRDYHARQRAAARLG